MLTVYEISVKTSVICFHIWLAIYTWQKLKVDGTVVQEEPGSSGKPKTKEPKINCPICLCTAISPVSTLCGHLFCETCLKTAMRRKKECPICRTKLTKKKIHRLFFSAIEWDALNLSLSFEKLKTDLSVLVKYSVICIENAAIYIWQQWPDTHPRWKW